MLLDLGLSDSNGSGLWGEDGDVNYYNKQLADQGLLTYHNGQYWGNIPVGTTIKLRRRKNNDDIQGWSRNSSGGSTYGSIQQSF